MPRRAIIPTDMVARRDRFPPRAPFAPSMLGSKLASMLDLSASAQSAGEWTDWIDTVNANPGVINAARRPAVSAGANGVPTATFATNDCVAWPITANNYSTTLMGFAFWMAPVAYGSAQSVISVGNGTGGASVRAFEFEIVSAPGRSMKCNIFDAASGVKTGTGAANSFPVAGVQAFCRIQYNIAGATDADKLKIWANEVPVVLTFGGAGTGLLRSTTGNILIGNYNNGVASQPYAGAMGPKLYALNAALTVDEGVALMNHTRPT